MMDTTTATTTAATTLLRWLQDETTPQQQPQPNNNNNNNTTGGDDKSSSDVAKDVVIIFLAGVAVVIGLVLVVYLLAIVFDKYCCCFPWFNPVTTMHHDLHNIHSLDHHQGVVARRAGLWGLKREERTQILEHVLVAKEWKESTKEDVENEKIGRSSNATAAATTLTTTKTTTEGIGKDSNQDDPTSASIMDAAQHELICAICLAEYAEGDLVVSGTSCQHLFHKDCVYEWLWKHDQCPYCRKEMITPYQMRETAKRILGEERVQHMSMWGVTEELMNASGEEEDREAGSGGVRQNDSEATGDVEMQISTSSSTPVARTPTAGSSTSPELEA